MYNIAIDSRYGYFMFLLVPIIIYNLKWIKSSNIYLFLIFTLAFIEGGLDLFGLSASVNRLMRDGLIILFFLNTILVKKGAFSFKFGLIIMVFTIITILSQLINNIAIIQLLTFYRRIFINFLLFWAVYNSNFSIIKEKGFFAFLVFLYLFQIFVAIYKVAIMGVNENFIGSISVRSGSLTTSYSMIGSIISFALYLHSGKKKYLYMIIGFVFFAFSGAKRAVAMYIPLSFILLFFINAKLTGLIKRLKFIQIFIFVTIGSFILFYILVITNPSLNPEGKIGGSFDIEFVIDYSQQYNSSEWREGNGRSNAPEAVYNLLLRDGLSHLLFGYGPGDIISSSANVSAGIGGDEQLVFEKYGLGYGTRTGFLWMFIQIGILGIGFYLLFFANIFRIIYLKLKSENRNYEILLPTLGIILFFFLDFITYSAMFTLSNVFTYILFCSLAISIKEVEKNY